MKLLFVTGIYSNEILEDLKRASKYPLQNAPNVFQWAVIDGLISNNVELNVLSCPFLPSFPFGYRKLSTPTSQIKYLDREIGYNLKYCTLAVYKQNSIENAIYSYAKRWCEKNRDLSKLYILTYTSWPEFILPILRLKKEFPNIVLASIITDLIDDASNFATNRTFLKRIQVYQQYKTIHRLYKDIDKVILLSKAMEEKIPEAINKNIVVEGIYNTNSVPSSVKDNDRKVRILSYTGSLQGFVGINELVDAFMRTTDPCYRLVICGSGESSNYINEKSALDSRIIFKGVVNRDEALLLQKNSTALVNPRKPNGGITKYSFPSKTMEYLASGRPMIGYRLEGIPEEYYAFMYVPSDLSVASLAYTIDKVLSAPVEELEEKASKAYGFILSDKTSIKQASRIINFIA